MYDLPLSGYVGTFREVDLEKNIKTKEELEDISDFKDKLIYYNNNIESLAFCAVGSPIIFEWGTPDQYLKIYCSCKNCRGSEKFNLKEEKFF